MEWIPLGLTPRIEESQACFDPDQKTYKRVWSWLRMNAGGVLNTCKSNGVIIFEAISLLGAEMLLT